MAKDIKTRIETANAEAFRRMVAADPVLVDVAPAGDVIPGLTDKMVLHSGPPVDWQRMSGAQKGAVIGMLLFEGWARSKEEAIKLLEDGAVTLEPNHHHQTVGPIAGTITRSMWVFVVENKAFGNRAYCRQVEGRQQFGDYSQEALQDLIRWHDIWAPALRAGLRQMGGLSLKPIIGAGLVRPPLDCFKRALIRFAEKYGLK